jgi:hypothetical protein
MRPPTLAVLICCLFPGVASGLQDTTGVGRIAVSPLVILGSAAEDRVRLAHVLGDVPADGFLIRSPSALSGVAEGGPEGVLHWAVLAPELRTIWSSDLPHSFNEGPLWAGRGLSTRLTAGARFAFRDITLLLAPQLVDERNRDFQTATFPEAGGGARHPLASPFHFPPGSMDLPQRLGEGPRRFVDPGQSSLTVLKGPLAFGAATENLWWGPGIRNALVMSSHAAGIPHLFVGTDRPLEIPWGRVEGRWIVGRLSESDYFDEDPSNDHRSLSGLVLVFSPAFDPSLSLGFARVVYAPSNSALPLGAAVDVFRNVGRPNEVPGDTLIAPAPDQIFSLFARWAFPQVGFEAYGEWGRFEQPTSLRDFLVLPNHSRGYTLGLQYARPLPSGAAFRLQSEVTNLEPSTTYRVRPFGEWYASRAVPQGYTHRGQVIGASIGPSGSSQWLAADFLSDTWNAGAVLGRIRWENQARYTYLPEFRRSDVSLFTGIRGGAKWGRFLLAGAYTRTVRLNFLFQSEPVTPATDRGVDIVNHTVEVTVSLGSFPSIGGFFSEPPLPLRP